MDSPPMSFEQGLRGLRELQSRFPDRIERVVWADDGRVATLTGSGYEVRCWYDERHLHIQGSIPLAWKLVEGVVRNRIKHDIDRAIQESRLEAISR